ncbi:17-beta-hydroxysteroid dehydrogenase type 1 isoform 1-T1 [Morphnus guianensis]
MEKTTVLITGCSSGIGLGLAARLAADTARRFKVYATMRDLAKGERLLERLGGCCPDTLEVLQLDVTDPCSLAAAAQRVQGQRLDVLGTALPGAPTIPWVAGGTSLGLPALPRALGADAKSWEVPAVLGLGWDVFSRAGVQELGLGVPRVTGPSIGKDPHVLVFWHLDGARECEGGSGAWLTGAVPSSLQCGGGTDGPPGDLLRPSHEDHLRREPLWGHPHHPGVPARHEAPQGRADHRLQQHRGAARAALQLCVLRQQVCGGGAVREPGHRPAALQHPPDTGGVWTRQHQLPGQPAAPGPRGQRAAGPGRRDAWPLPPVPAALPEPLPRRGPGGGRGPAGQSLVGWG